MAQLPTPRDDDGPVAEAARILSAAHDAGPLLRATGGVAIALIAPAASEGPLARPYQDIDFVGLSQDAHAIREFFASLGYLAEQEFNALHGQRRLFFAEPDGRWHADVFLDRIEMCHSLDLRDRLNANGRTLSPADLLLSKLQVVETNEKDFKDALALLAEHAPTAGDEGISLERMADVCCSDWGWWRTVTMVGARTREAAARYRVDASEPATRSLDQAVARLDAVLDHVERAPKSRRWKVRARIGERVRWHELPEDIDHEDHQ